jgi:hypothetical protein
LNYFIGMMRHPTGRLLARNLAGRMHLMFALSGILPGATGSSAGAQSPQVMNWPAQYIGCRHARRAWQAMTFVAGFIGVAASALAAEGPAVAEVAREKETVRQTAPGLFEIGLLRLDQNRRTITFPAVVNLSQGPVEYLLVTDYGKIHESLLRTEVAPHHVQVALLLLGAKRTEWPVPSVPAQGSSAGPSGRESGEATARKSQREVARARGPAVVARPKPMERLTIEIAWSVKGRSRRSPAGAFVQDRRARGRIGKGQWAFVGSRIREDGFAAQADGSIISLIDDPDAILANWLPGSDDDDNWLAMGQKLPPMDSRVEVIVTVGRP